MLFISPLWPERSSSAAGVRTCDLIQGFQSWGWPVTYLSAAAQNEHSQVLEESGVGIIACPMNRRAFGTLAYKRVFIHDKVELNSISTRLKCGGHIHEIKRKIQLIWTFTTVCIFRPSYFNARIFSPQDLEPYAVPLEVGSLSSIADHRQCLKF